MKLSGIIVIVALSALVVTARVQAAGCGGCEQPTAAPAKEAPAKEAAAKEHCPMMAGGCPMSNSIDKAIALLDQAKDATDLAKVRELVEQARKQLADGKAHMAKAAASGKSAWSCPMHPQVHQASAGKCPVCGMALKELKPAAPTHGGPHH